MAGVAGGCRPKLKAAGDQRQHPAALPLPGQRLFELPNEQSCQTEKLRCRQRSRSRPDLFVKMALVPLAAVNPVRHAAACATPWCRARPTGVHRLPRLCCPFRLRLRRRQPRQSPKTLAILRHPTLGGFVRHSPADAFFFASRSFLMSASGLRFRPRPIRLRARAGSSWMSSSVPRSSSCSRSTPR